MIGFELTGVIAPRRERVDDSAFYGRISGPGNLIWI